MSVIDWLLDSDHDRVAEAIAIVEEKRDAAADGRSRSRTRARTTSRWTRAWASPVVGTRSTRCGCFAGRAERDGGLPRPVEPPAGRPRGISRGNPERRAWPERVEIPRRWTCARRAVLRR